jgi:hypothetical protein
MQLTDSEKKDLQEKIDQEPAARKERNEKTIGISTGVIGGLLFPIGVILGTYWFLRGRRTRGAYALMTVAWIIGIQWGINLFTKVSFTLLSRLLQ